MGMKMKILQWVLVRGLYSKSRIYNEQIYLEFRNCCGYKLESIYNVTFAPNYIW